MKTPKILFKLSTLRNPKKQQNPLVLVTTNEDSVIFNSIREKKPEKEISKGITEALQHLAALTQTTFFNELLNVYELLGSMTGADGYLSREIFADVFGNRNGFDHKNLLYSKRDYSNLLVAIKLSSNRTEYSQRASFIPLLKAWSVIHMYDMAEEAGRVRWINVYSQTFVIPLRKSDLPQHPESERIGIEDPEKTQIKPFKDLVADYKATEVRLEQLENVITGLNDLELVERLKSGDMQQAGTLEELAQRPLFKSVFTRAGFQTLRSGPKKVRVQAMEDLESRLDTVAKAKRTQLIRQAQEILSPGELSGDKADSAQILKVALTAQVNLKHALEVLKDTSRQHYGKDLAKTGDQQTFVPMYPKLPIVPVIGFPGKAKTNDAPLFSLLVSDLVLVEEQDRGYIASGIAHIETAMQGELRSKTHRTLDRMERRLTSSEAVEVRQSLNLATNDQHNFQSEVEEAQKRKFGGDARMQYSGGMVKVDVSAYYDDESSKVAQAVQKVAEEITEEARIEVARKIEQQRSEININEVEIINEHKIENTTDEHINGIYQWVDQVKEFRTYNYGKHLMCKLILPDPARLLFMKTQEDPAADIEEFPLRYPTEITHHHMALEIGKKYGITEFEAMPYRIQTLTSVLEFSEKTAQEVSDGYVIHKQIIQIPRSGALKGYYISNVSIRYNCPWRGSDRREVNINLLDSFFHVASRKAGDADDQWDPHWFNTRQSNGYTVTTDPGATGVSVNPMSMNKSFTSGELHFSFPANDTVGLTELPIAITTRNSSFFQATVVVTLTATEHDEQQAVYAWQKNVYDILFQAYLRKREEALRQVNNEKQDQLLQVISGKNPLKNKQLIQDELKRQVITVLSDGTNHLFKGYFTESDADYEVQTEEIRQYANYIDFFENAIDWEKMSYRLFSYYWHHHERWELRQSYEDSDPHFEAFMKAGAAELTIPVMRGYERQFMHYIDNGSLWNHNEPLSITYEENPDLLVEINELIDSEQRDPESIGHPWRARIPTNLIILSEKNSLDPIPALNEPEDGEDPES